MKGIIEWYNTDFYNIIFTLITVGLSGLISLIISHIYFWNGNRNNLKMSVIYPLIDLLKRQYTNDNYQKIVKLSKDYSVRYLKKREREQLFSLLNVYKKAIVKTEDNVCVDILFDFFLNVLKKENINVYVIPIEIDGELVDYDFPSDLYSLEDNLKKNNE